MIAGTADAEEPLQLPEITVEASRVDALLPALTVVDREELIDSHKSELGGVLDLTPGVNVREGGRGEPRLDMRGFDQRAVLFTLNGVPVFEPWNGIINLNLFPIDMFESVSLARGPSSSLYGPNGLAGAVKLETFHPRTPLSGALATQWRNSDFWDSRAEGAVSKNGVELLLGGRYLTNPGFPLPADFDDRPPTRRRFENGGLRDNSDRDEKSLFTHLGYQYSEQGKAQLTLLASTASFGIPISTTAFLGPFLHNDGEDLLHVQGGVEQRLTPDLGLALVLFHTAYDTSQSTFPDPEMTERTVTNDVDADETGGMGKLTYDFSAADSLAGVLQLRRGQAHVSDDVGGPTADPSFLTASVAAENVYTLWDRVALVAGLSLDMQSSSGSGTTVEPDPQGGVSVDWGEYGTSRAAISRKVRFPTLSELFDPLRGNPDLVAEKAVVYEVGHRLDATPGYVDLNLFRSDVSDLISNEGGEMGRSINLQDATLQGLEIALGAVAPWARVDVNYTYLNTSAEATTRGATTESDVQHKPPHRFNGVAQVFMPWAFTLRLEGLYSSEQLDRFGSEVSVDAYTLFNAQLSWRLYAPLQLYAGADNLLDAENEDKLGSPGPGRWVFVGLRLSYN